MYAELPFTHMMAHGVRPLIASMIACASLLSGCGTTIEIPAVSFQLPGAKIEAPVPSVKLPDLKAQTLIAKIDEARKVGGLATLKAESAALKTMFASATANDFLDAVESLPAVPTRTIYFNESERKWLSPKEYDALAKSARSRYRAVEQNEARYYSTNYGSPLAYARALDIANLHGVSSLNGMRVLDYGYGAIGAARLMSASGGDVVGIDVDSMLPALYHVPSDVGAIVGAGGRRGNLTLLHGTFPNDAAIKSRVGAGYDLVVSKNTLKKGYVTPTSGKPMIETKLPAVEYLRGFADAMKPGALWVIYNVSGAQPRDGYVPTADGRSPFTTEEFQEAGFKVLAFNQNDDAAVRQMGQLLGWDKQMGDLSRNLFALYTVVRK
jgi:hypothetical protein